MQYPAYASAATPMKTPLAALLAHKDPTVRSVPSTASVAEAAALMAEHHIGCVVVADDGRLSGIFTERDLLTRVVARRLDPQTTPVARVMSPQPLVVDPTLALEEAMALISEKRIRHLPVLEDGRLVGLISIGDVNKWVVEHLQSEAQSLRSYISGQYPV